MGLSGAQSPGEPKLTPPPIVEKSVSGFATGLSPIMAVEIGRRSLDKQIQPTADELEEKCKDAAKGA